MRHELTLGRVVVNQNGSRTFTERLSKTEDARTVPVPGPVMDALQEHLLLHAGAVCAGVDAPLLAAQIAVEQRMEPPRRQPRRRSRTSRTVPGEENGCS